MTAEVLAPIVAGLAFAYLAIISVALVIIDVRTHRLPDRVVLPGYPLALALFAISAMVAADPGRFWRAVAGMAVLFLGYFVVRFTSPSSLGGGDVKLAGLLGLYLGWMGWDAVLIATIATFLIGGAHALVLLSARRAHRRTRLPFGPAMVGGAWVAVVLAVVPSAADALPA